ncbi:MAG: methyltransferase domain-containing protein [Bacteroidia bacterium]|nr:MAG: methyltransferase domain-containing protein [Bacteroidia bacterium]
MDQYTNSIAKRYDTLSGQDCCLSCGGAFSFAEVRPGDVCIDLGCGKGRDVLRMATLSGEEGYAYGVDISDGMMDTAGKQAEILGLKNIGFVKSPLEEISLEDDIADVIISNCTINHSLQQDKVWQEIARLLKKGGHFVVSDIYAVETVPDAFRNNPEMVAECWAGAVTREVYFENVINAGLHSIEVLEESQPYEKGKIKVASFTIKGMK